MFKSKGGRGIVKTSIYFCTKGNSNTRVQSHPEIPTSIVTFLFLCSQGPDNRTSIEQPTLRPELGAPYACMISSERHTRLFLNTPN